MGFAKNAKSKRWIRRAIKLFVFVICTAGFLYHTWTFLELYLTYPTMLDVSEEYPDSFSAPAITICNRNRFWRQRYCRKYPELCEFPYTTWEEFCDANRRWCPTSKPRRFNFGIPDLTTGRYRNRGYKVLNAVGPQEETDFVIDCYHIGPGSLGAEMACNSSFRMIQAARVGFPHKCFTFNSLIGKPYEESLNLTFTDNYLIKLDLHPGEYMNNYELVQVWVVLHDPRKLVNPMTEGVTLTAGKSYMLYPTIEKRESLPPPYTSKCKDYLKKWKKNGGYGPLSKKDCIDLCKIKAMTDEYGCVGRSMTYPNNYTVCKYGDADASPEMNRICSRSCREACEEMSYRFTSEIDEDLHTWCDAEDEYCKNKELSMIVSYSRMIVQKFQQIPRFESIELFSYIGGYLGMWLGISLASLFDVGEWIYDVIAYQRMRWKRNQKATTPVEKFRSHTLLKKRINTVNRRKFY